MSDLARALMVAIRVHAGQTDKQGKPYLLHVLRVVEAVPDDAKPVAALHDAVEDGNRTLSDVCAEAGCDDDERQALKAITRWGDEYAVYIDRIRRWSGISGAIAQEVKVADLRDNLMRIPEPPYFRRGTDPDWEGLRRRYEKALTVLEGVQSSLRGYS